MRFQLRDPEGLEENLKQVKSCWGGRRDPKQVGDRVADDSMSQ